MPPNNRLAQSLSLDHDAIWEQEMAELAQKQARARSGLRLAAVPQRTSFELPSFVAPPRPHAVPPRPAPVPGKPPPHLSSCDKCRASCWRFGRDTATCSSSCSAALRQESRLLALAPAFASVPERQHRSARLDARTWELLDRPRRRLSDGSERPFTLDQARVLSQRLDTWQRVFLLGPAGAGKTTLACALLNEFLHGALAPDAPDEHMALAHGSRFVLADTLARAADEARLGERPDAVKEALRAPVLVLDELGASAESHRSYVDRVLHERHALPRSTIVTTGQTVVELTKHRGGGIERRLQEEAWVILLGDQVERT